MSLEGLAAVEDMAATAQRVEGVTNMQAEDRWLEQTHGLGDMDYERCLLVNTQIAAWGYSIHVLLLARLELDIR